MKNPTLTRRGVLGAAIGGAMAAVAAGQAQRNYSSPNPARYPDADIIALDKRFNKYKIGNTPIRRLHTGMLWAEGPAWNGAGRYLVWSDIPNDVQMRFIEDDNHVSVMRNPAGYSNGNTFDWHGRQLSCEHGNRRVVRYEQTGAVTVLADKYNGKKLNAPNDIVVHPNGDVWFTDPGYGALLNYEGFKADLELKEAVYRIDASTGKLSMVTDDLYKPNGICFSPDYKKLYIADTGVTHYPEAKDVVKVYDIAGEKTLKNGKVFLNMEMAGKGSGRADGIRADTDGNIWVGGGWVGAGYDGVHCFAPDGQRIGLILLPEICANLTFGGVKRNRLFMAASQSLYVVYTEAIGAHIA